MFKKTNKSEFQNSVLYNSDQELKDLTNLSIFENKILMTINTKTDEFKFSFQNKNDKKLFNNLTRESFFSNLANKFVSQVKEQLSVFPEKSYTKELSVNISFDLPRLESELN